MAKCLYCYKELNEGEKDFHKACSKKMFGTPNVPELPYTRKNLTDLYNIDWDRKQKPIK